MKKIIFNNQNAKPIGRTIVNNNVLQLIMSASGCEFSFIGKKLSITLGCDADSLKSGNECNFPRIAVMVNNRFVLKKVISSAEKHYTIFESKTAEKINVKIIKLSEAAFSIAKLYPAEINDDEEILPVSPKELKLEFIGDSITCGYGIDCSIIDSSFSTSAENAMKSYAYLTAEALNADYSFFSASGYGVFSGYTSDGERNKAELIPPYYDSLGFSYSSVDGKKAPHEIMWDFKSFVPDIVIINLGTNDDSFYKKNCSSKVEFEAAYNDFLKKVRSHYPDAEIICSVGIIDTEMFPVIENVCSRYCEEYNDSRIHTFKFDAQDGRLGYASNWHPSEDTHILAAEKLSEYLKKF